MEMSVAYLADTVASMSENGWTLETDEDYIVVEGVLSSMITKHRLSQGDDRLLTIEAIAYADGTEAYFTGGSFTAPKPTKRSGSLAGSIFCSSPTPC